MNDEIENDEMLDEFEEIANKYYDMLLKIHYKEPYLNKSQNERFHNFLQAFQRGLLVLLLRRLV